MRLLVTQLYLEELYTRVLWEDGEWEREVRLRVVLTRLGYRTPPTPEGYEALSPVSRATERRVAEVLATEPIGVREGLLYI